MVLQHFPQRDEVRFRLRTKRVALVFGCKLLEASRRALMAPDMSRFTVVPWCFLSEQAGGHSGSHTINGFTAQESSVTQTSGK